MIDGYRIGAGHEVVVAGRLHHVRALDDVGEGKRAEDGRGVAPARGHRVAALDAQQLQLDAAGGLERVRLAVAVGVVRHRARDRRLQIGKGDAQRVEGAGPLAVLGRLGIPGLEQHEGHVVGPAPFVVALDSEGVAAGGQAGEAELAVADDELAVRVLQPGRGVAVVVAHEPLAGQRHGQAVGEDVGRAHPEPVGDGVVGRGVAAVVGRSDPSPDLVVGPQVGEGGAVRPAVAGRVGADPHLGGAAALVAEGAQVELAEVAPCPHDRAGRKHAIAADVGIDGELDVGGQVAEDDQAVLAGMPAGSVDADVVAGIVVAPGHEGALRVAEQKGDVDVVARSGGTLVGVDPVGRIAVPVVALPVDAHDERLGGEADLDLAQVDGVAGQGEAVVGVDQPRRTAVGSLARQRGLREALAKRQGLVVREAHGEAHGQVRGLGEDVEGHVPGRVGGLERDRGRVGAGAAAGGARGVLRLPALERAAAAARRLDHAGREAQVGAAVDEGDGVGRGRGLVPQRIGNPHARVGGDLERLVRQGAHAREDRLVALLRPREGDGGRARAVRCRRGERVPFGVGIGEGAVEVDLHSFNQRPPPAVEAQDRRDGDGLVRDVGGQVHLGPGPPGELDGLAHGRSAVRVAPRAQRIDGVGGEVGNHAVGAPLQRQELVASVGVGQLGPDVARARALEHDRESGMRQQVLAAGVEGVVLRVLVDVEVADDAGGARGGAREIDHGGLAAREGEGEGLRRVEGVGAGVVAGDRDPVGARTQVGEAVASFVVGGGGVVGRAREDDRHAVQPRAVDGDAAADAGGAQTHPLEGDVRGLAARQGDGLDGDGELVGVGVVAGDVQAVLPGAQSGERVEAGGVGGGRGGLAVGAGEVDGDVLEAGARHAHLSGDLAVAQVLAVEAGDPRLVRLQAEGLPRAVKRDVGGVEARDLDRVVARAQVGERVFAVGGG